MAFRSASSNTTPAISVTVPVPAGVVAGDVIILYSTTDVTDNAAALPAGFTLLPAGVLVTNSDNSGFKAWVKIAGASESAFVVDNSAGGVALIAGALAFSGRNGAQFIASLAAATTGVVNLNLGGGASNSSIVSPANVDAKGLTAPLGADLLWLGNADISVFGALTSFTPPSGYTIAHGLSSGFLAMGAAYKENTSAGATGDVSGTVTFSSGASGASAFLLAIPAQTVSGYPNLKSSATPFLTNGTTQVAAVVQPLPATYSLGDLLLWVIHSDTTAACTYPSGWTALASVSSSVDQGTLSVGWRYATGSEPANYTATPATSDWIASSMYAVTGVASTSAINVFANSADTSTNTTIIPAVSVTTTSANTLVLWVGAADNLADLVSNSAGYIEPAGYARADYVSNPNWCSFDLAYAYKAAAGIEAVGTGSVAAGASGGQMAIVLAIAPAPTGPLFDSALFDSVLFDPVLFDTAVAGGGGVTVALTGQSVTAAAGTVSAAVALAISGQGVASASGTITAATGAPLTLALSGQAFASAVGQITLGRAAALVGQASAVAAGLLAPASSVSLAGTAVGTAAGTIVATIGVNVSLSGQAAAFTAGTITLTSSPLLAGQAVASAAGTIVPAIGLSVALTGQSATFTPGALSVSIDRAVSGQPGSFSAGSLAAALSAALAGSGAAAAAGSLAPALAAALAGTAVAASAGSLAPSFSVTLNGRAVAVDSGTLSASLGGDLVLSLGGQGVSAFSGQLALGASASIGGQAAVYATGVLAAALAPALSGHAATFTGGSLTVSMSRNLLGTQVTSFQGTLTTSVPFVTISLAGTLATFTAGTVLVDGAPVVNLISGGFIVNVGRLMGR